MYPTGPELDAEVLPFLRSVASKWRLSWSDCVTQNTIGGILSYSFEVIDTYSIQVIILDSPIRYMNQLGVKGCQR